jgi:Na+/proline symporter
MYAVHPGLILLFILLYFSALLLISGWTARKAGNDSYFLGDHASPWYAVAIGMIGDSLSGVTYISVPGQVGTAHFSYMQIVLGYVVGYWLIALILLPLYYRMQLTSIYTYLLHRFGPRAQKTGSFFFILSRLLGAAGRLYLAISVLQLFVFDAMGIPFALSTAVVIGLMLVYTLRGGIKTLVWTDVFQSFFLLMGVVFSILFISRALDYQVSEVWKTLLHSPHTQVFHWDVLPKTFFWKQFLAGIFICVAMTGLDQNMMQKNLSCRSLPEAQKNMFWFSGIVLVVNFLFLALGALLFHFAEQKGIAIPEKTDALFPLLAMQHLGTAAGMMFIVGLTAATFNSADSVLTSLTTAWYMDFLPAERQTEKIRIRIHIGFGILLLMVILVFQAMQQDAIINTILMLAGFTYGPLLGLFAMGITTQRNVNDRWIPLICIIAPVTTWLIQTQAPDYLGGYQIGSELLVINGGITLMGLWLIHPKTKST